MIVFGLVKSFQIKFKHQNGMVLMDNGRKLITGVKAIGDIGVTLQVGLLTEMQEKAMAELRELSPSRGQREPGVTQHE